MIPEEIAKMMNPYNPGVFKLPAKKFIGREEEIEKLYSILDPYEKTLNLRNIILRGDRTVGKSCLLNRYRQILEDFNFVVYDVELSRESTINIDEFEFFKDIIDELFVKYAPDDGFFFDAEQSEIWFSLTSDQYQHNSNYQDRKISFATQYASRKSGTIENLSTKQLQNDFDTILGQLISPEMGINGFAILIDEFQELIRKPQVLEQLRTISENSIGLVIIGAGLPTYINNSVFEKYCRGAESVNLSQMSREEVLDLIFTPFEQIGSYSRHEVSTWFDTQSILQIVERAGGNPLHVNILCSKMFEHYQMNASLNKITLNSAVMEKVNEYYSNISEKSRKINLSLQSCTSEQLEIFSLLYQYEGFSFRVAVLLNLAFNLLTPQIELQEKNALLSSLAEIWGLGLFEIIESEMSPNDLLHLDINKLANVQYKFIGDPIDKLYASYYYEELTGQTLFHNDGKSFEDLLAIKLAEEFDDFLREDPVPNSTSFFHFLEENPLINIFNSEDTVSSKA